MFPLSSCFLNDILDRVFYASKTLVVFKSMSWTLCEKRKNMIEIHIIVGTQSCDMFYHVC
jgi:hypothetical protein